MTDNKLPFGVADQTPIAAKVKVSRNPRTRIVRAQAQQEDANDD